MKKDDILQALWFGDLNPQKLSNLEDNIEYSELIKEFNDSNDNLKRIMHPEQTELLENMIRKQEELSTFMELDCFKTGFKLGVKLVIQSLQ